MVERNFRGCLVLISSLLGTIFVSGAVAHSQSLLPENFTIEGRLYDSTGAPLNNGPVDIELELLVDNAVNDPTKTCVLFRELHSGINIMSADPNVGGEFALRMGTGTLIYPTSAPGMGSLFTPGAYNGNNDDTTANNCTVTAASGDHRFVRIKVRSAVNAPNFDTLSPDTRITAVPSAHVADTAFTLQGKTPTDFLLTNTSTKLSQLSVENIFTTANYNALVALLNGTSTQFIPASPGSAVSLNSQRLINVSDPTGPQDAATRNYSDTKLGGKNLDVSAVGLNVGGGSLLYWDQGQNKWIASNTAAVTYLGAGPGLKGGPVTGAGTLWVDTGTTANKILQLNSTGQIPAVDGFLVTNVNAVKLQARDIAASAPSNGDELVWNTLSNQWQPTASMAITALTGDVTTAAGPGSVAATIANNTITSAKINNSGHSVSRLLITDSTTGDSVTYANCGLGEVLKWGALGWGCSDVTTLLGNTSVTVGTYGNASQVSQITVDAQGRVTSLSNVNIAFPVLSVAGRTGDVTLIAGDVAGLGNAATQNYGTASGDLVQLSGAAQLPALDGSNLTNVNATQLTGRAIATAAPAPNQVLTWNGSQWEGQTPSSAPVLSVSFTAPMVNLGSASAPNISIPQSDTTHDGYLAHADWNTFNDTASNAILKTGTVSFTADQSMGVHKLTNLSAPTAGTDAVNKNYADANLRGKLLSGPTVAQNGQSVSWNNTTSQWDYVTLMPANQTFAGDVTGNAGATVVATVNGSTAAQVHSAELAANAATSANIGFTIVQRDVSGGFVAGNISTTSNVFRDLGANNVTLQAPDAVTTSYALKLPTAQSVGSQVLANDGTGNLSWTTAAVGTVTGVTASAPLSSSGSSTPNITIANATTTATGVMQVGGGLIVTAGTVSVDTGVTADKIVQLNGSSQIQLANGTASTPSYSFGTSLGTGMYLPASDNIGFSTANSERMHIDSSGNVGIGTTTPSSALQVVGTVTATTFSGALSGNASTVTTNANLTGPITSVGNTTSVGSQTGTGSTFVMQTSPTLTAPVIGAATGTSLSVSGQLTSTLSTGTAPLVVSSTTQVANLNAATAGNASTVTTNANLTGPITSIGNATSVGSQTGTGSTFVMQTSPTLTTPTFTTSITGPLHAGGTAASSSLVLESTSGAGTSDYIAFQTASQTEKMRITTTGNIGIGTTGPLSKVDVNGGMAIGLYAGVNAAPSNGLIVSGNVGVGTATPTSTLQVNGSIAGAIATKTANYTLTTQDNVILANASSGSVTMTLPTAAGIAGRQYTIKKYDLTSNTVLIQTSGGQFIDGLASTYTKKPMQVLSVISDGVNWAKIDGDIITGAYSACISSGGTWGIALVAAGGCDWTLTTAGSYFWTAPIGVTSISVVVVGGGGGGNADANNGAGGGGGALCYSTIVVSPGNQYAVNVGAGGTSGSNGGNSSFDTISAGGGKTAPLPGGGLGGTGSGTVTCNSGGPGGSYMGGTQYGAGGGGAGGYAGGYAGVGGAGGNSEGGLLMTNQTAGAGGAGGGGGGASDGTNFYTAGGAGGGGVGILGQGANGTSGSSSTGSGVGQTGGGGGSGGASGTNPILTYNGGNGGGFGGGGAGAAYSTYTSGTGGGGVVRIIWGTGRTFPVTLTGTP